MERLKLRPEWATLAAALVLLLGGFLVFEELDREPIKIWDEARGAVNAMEMPREGDWLVVRYEGKPDYWNTKPPVYVWLKVASYKLFGINEFGARFPSALAAVLTMVALLGFSRWRLGSWWPGVLAVLGLASSAGYLGYHVARFGEPDSLLILLVTSYALHWFWMLEKKRILWRDYLLFLALVVLAAMTKSVAGLAPLAGVALYTAARWRKALALARDWRFYLSIALTLLPIGLYYYLRGKDDPEYVAQVLRGELGLFGGYYLGNPKHPEFGFYWNDLTSRAFANTWWLLALALPALFAGTAPRARRLLLFALAMFGALLLGFSSSVTKNEWYLSTAYPFLSLSMGLGAYLTLRLLGERARRPLLGWGLAGSVVGLLAFAHGHGVDQARQAYLSSYDPLRLYDLERMGHFIRQNEEVLAGLDSLWVLHKPNDQLEFYTQRLERQHGVWTRTTPELPRVGVGANLLLSNSLQWKALKSRFGLRVLARDKYAVLVRLAPQGQGDPRQARLTLGYPNLADTRQERTPELPAWAEAKTWVGSSFHEGERAHYLWFADSTYAVVGADGQARGPFAYALPEGYGTADIVGVGTDGQTYFWMRDGMVIAGTPQEPASFEAPRAYAPAAGKEPEQILAMAIDGVGDKVFTWYDDGSYSVGSAERLDAESSGARYELPPDQPGGPRGIGMDGAWDQVHAWY